MHVERPTVCEIEHAITIDAPADLIWTRLADVRAWPTWNAGVAVVELHGPFATGSEFVMRLPSGERFASRLVEVTEGRGFVDETPVGDVRVFVDHRLEPLPDGGTRVVYSLEAFGDDCDAVAQRVAADFTEVLAALAKTVTDSATCSLQGAAGA